MDEKCMRTPVFNLETVFKDSAEVPVDVDFTMPDYCPEISKILKCRATARISSEDAQARKITVDGVVTVTVIYADDENNINSYEYQYPFSKSFDTACDVSDSFVRTRAKCEYINCRAINERKIDVHGAVGVYVNAMLKKSREIICDIDDEGIEVRRSGIPATMPLGYSSKYVLIEDEIPVGDSQPDVMCLIRYDSAVKLGECKLLSGKAIIKGELMVNLLYRGEGGLPQSLDTVIPFSQLVEIEGIGEDCDCEARADVAYLEVKPKFNSSSVSRGFSVDGKIRLTAEAFCQNDVEVVIDAYSREYEAQITGDEVYFNKLICSINDTFSAVKTIDFPSDTISRVCDASCEVKNVSTEFEGDCLVVSGTAVCGIMALDNDGAPSYYERPVEYEYRYKLPVSAENLIADSQVDVVSVGYTMSGDKKTELRVELSVTASVYSPSKVSLISDVQVNREKPAKNNNRGALTVYFAESGEQIWDIARKYLADINEVKRINDIKDDNLTSGQMILVPVK